MNRFSPTFFAIAAGVLLVFGAQAADFTLLGDLPEHFGSTAADVSADGSVVVGQSQNVPCCRGIGFDSWRWTSSGGMQDLGLLPVLPGCSRGGRDTGAFGVSADGSVVVGTTEGNACISHAFRWTSEGGMVALTGVPPASSAAGVSADGSVVVGRSIGVVGTGTVGIGAFRWSSGDIVPLGDLPGGFSSATPHGVSADGSVVVGGSGSDAGQEEVFRWTSGGGMVGLGFLRGGEGFSSSALGVSADGSVVVGGSASAATLSSPEAFRWTSDGGMVGLGFLAGFSFFSSALGVSADGSVVVGNDFEFGQPEAFVWTQANGMQSLRDVLISNGATGLADWTLETATAISPDGQWIVGGASNSSGDREAYLAKLDVPVVARFNDVPTNYWAFSFIETLAASGITAGCGNGSYCPLAPVTRAQMAVFLERGMRGSGFVPPAASGNVFLDVGANEFAANFIEQLSSDGITSGCGNNKYCPTATVTRDQMAVFLLRAKHGAGFSPPPATGIFNDVPLGFWAGAWIEQLAAEGITAGCGTGNYCPAEPVTRDQMAVFLVRTFGL